MRKVLAYLHRFIQEKWLIEVTEKLKNWFKIAIFENSPNIPVFTIYYGETWGTHYTLLMLNIQQNKKL